MAVCSYKNITIGYDLVRLWQRFQHHALDNYINGIKKTLLIFRYVTEYRQGLFMLISAFSF